MLDALLNTKSEVKVFLEMRVKIEFLDVSPYDVCCYFLVCISIISMARQPYSDNYCNHYNIISHTSDLHYATYHYS